MNNSPTPELISQAICQMCGSKNGDFWETRPARGVILSARPRAGDIFQAWTICDECREGLLGLALSVGKRRTRH
jgi:hypothetical protein